MKQIFKLQIIPDPGSVHVSLRPQYEYQWPEDLPSSCPSCGTEFETSWNLKIGPNREGRLLKKAATAPIAPCLIGLCVIILLIPVVIWIPGNDLLLTVLSINFAYIVLQFMILSPVMYFISHIMPKKRIVDCKKCDWIRDYSLLKTDLKLPKHSI